MPEGFRKLVPKDYLEQLPSLVIPEGEAFGPVEVEALSAAQYYGGSFLARNWVITPHVTHHDEADITGLELLRKTLAPTAAGSTVGLTILLVKALVLALTAFPKFNASLDATARKVIYRKYYNIGMAVDTPQGLLVPVLKGVDHKSREVLADELATLSRQARDKGLTTDQMSGGTFTVSSLGGLGGIAFTPIINAPEVAILGVAKSCWKPGRGPGDTVEWRLKLPLSLSYDHRLINGADAARFLTFLCEILADPDRLPE